MDLAAVHSALSYNFTVILARNTHVTAMRPAASGKHMLVEMKSNSLDVEDKSRLKESTKHKSNSYGHTNFYHLPGN